MKIVYVTPKYLPHIGGVEIYVNNCAKYFKSKGNQITVITADEKRNTILINEEEGIKIIHIPVYSLSGLLFVKKRSFLSVVNEEISSADIVHLNDCKFLYRYLANHKERNKLFLSSHGFVFHTKKHQLLKRIFFKFIVEKNKEKYDKIICVSEQDEQIAKSFNIFNLVVITPGVDIHKFECEKKSEEKNNHIFLYWGRIARNKGIAECLKKLSSVDFFSFILAGICEDDNYMNELKLIIDANRLTDKVHFIGFKNDSEIKELIKNCDYILMPSLHEGFGMTLAESLLSNRKIIANTNDSFCTILSQTDSKRFLFNFEDPNSDINKKIVELDEITVRPKNVEQYSLDSMYKRLEAIYK